MTYIRHATVNAIWCLARGLEDYPRDSGWAYIQACDWTNTTCGSIDCFTAMKAVYLMRGLRVEMPTCPNCAVFVDMAILEGMKVEQEAKDKAKREERDNE